ncbi:MAG: hypothetical protein WKF77_30825 [Planctomycetaceae bacterium]
MPTQTRRMVLRSLVGATICAGFPVMATAGEGCCSRCGCSAKRCRKICRLVQEDRKITTTCWGMQCKDFCVPGPSTPDCKHCQSLCSKGPDDNQICVKPKRLVWTSWIPGCGQEIFTKHKLMKKTVTTTVPSFKWVVEVACTECVASIEPILVPAGTTVPPAPQIDGGVVVASKATP